MVSTGSLELQLQAEMDVERTFFLLARPLMSGHLSATWRVASPSRAMSASL